MCSGFAIGLLSAVVRKLVRLAFLPKVALLLRNSVNKADHDQRTVNLNTPKLTQVLILWRQGGSMLPHNGFDNTNKPTVKSIKCALNFNSDLSSSSSSVSTASHLALCI